MGVMKQGASVGLWCNGQQASTDKACSRAGQVGSRTGCGRGTVCRLGCPTRCMCEFVLEGELVVTEERMVNSYSTTVEQYAAGTLIANERHTHNMSGTPGACNWGGLAGCAACCCLQPGLLAVCAGRAGSRAGHTWHQAAPQGGGSLGGPLKHTAPCCTSHPLPCLSCCWPRRLTSGVRADGAHRRCCCCSRSLGCGSLHAAAGGGAAAEVVGLALQPAACVCGAPGRLALTPPVLRWRVKHTAGCSTHSTQPWQLQARYCTGPGACCCCLCVCFVPWQWAAALRCLHACTQVPRCQLWRHWLLLLLLPSAATLAAAACAGL